MHFILTYHLIRNAYTLYQIADKTIMAVAVVSISNAINLVLSDDTTICLTVGNATPASTPLTTLVHSNHNCLLCILIA